jgi:hypothetical protein
LASPSKTAATGVEISSVNWNCPAAAMSGSITSAKWERTPAKTASSIRPDTAFSSGLRAVRAVMGSQPLYRGR